MSDNFESHLSNEEVIYITLLMGMYQDNLNQIENLRNANNSIRDVLLEMVRRTNRQRGAPTSNLNAPSNNSNESESVSTPRTPPPLFSTQPPPSAPLQPITQTFPQTFLQTPVLPASNLNTSYRNNYGFYSNRLHNPPQRSYNRRVNTNRELFNNEQDRIHTYWMSHSNIIDASGNNVANSNNNDIFQTIDGYSRIFETFFQPVDIFPTPTQIEQATRPVRYGDILRPLNNSCPISLEPFNDTSMVCMIRYCGHIFNPDELSNWFRSNCRCPVCRYDIRNYTPERPNQTNQPSEQDNRPRQ
jgi:hypothetical protein